MTDDDDLALQTLLLARLEAAPSLDEDVLRKCYAIQKRYQFSEERVTSMAAMERLIDAMVSKASGESQ
jgi:hypothetical protein